MTSLSSPAEILNNPAASFWLKDALRAALKRDPVDALRDAEVLRDVLQRHLDKLLLQQGFARES